MFKVATDSSSRRSRRQRWIILALLSLTLCLVSLMLLEIDGVNGPSYWRWPWRRMDIGDHLMRAAAAIIPPAAAILFSWRQWRRRAWSAASALAVMVLATAALQLLVQGQSRGPLDLRYLASDVQSAAGFSYFTDAMTLQPRGIAWLATHHQIVPELNFHSTTHPPGPILFCQAFLTVAPTPTAAAFGVGLMVTLLASLAAPACYFSSVAMGFTRRQAMAAAVVVCFCPGVLLFTPFFDAAYIILGATVIGCWAHAVRHESLGCAMAAGLALALACFFAYNMLVLGAFFAMLTLAALGLRGLRGGGRVLFLGAAAFVSFLAFYLGLFLAFGYRPVLSLLASIEMQRGHLQWLQRELPQTIPWDLYDFALGMGYLPVLLMGCWLASCRWRRQRSPIRWRQWIALAGLAQLLIVACTGLLQAETARVWLFMLPLAVAPAGAGLAMLSPRGQFCYLVLAGTVLAFVHATMRLF